MFLLKKKLTQFAIVLHSHAWVANVEYEPMKQLFMLRKVKNNHFLSIVKHKWFGNCKGHA